MPTLLKKQATINTNHKVLGVAPCNIAGNNIWQQEVLFEAIVDFAKKTGVTVRNFILNGHPFFGDESLVLDLTKRLEECNIPTEIIRLDSGAQDVWGRIAECNMVVSVRLHGAISSYLCNIPFALAEYHEKCTEFVKDIGQHEQLRLLYGNSTYQETLNALDCLYKDSSSRWSIPPERYAEEALLNFTAAPWLV